MKPVVRVYADGGKVLEREYGAGKPTYGKALMARVGVGDGYGKAKAPKAKKPREINVANATQEFGNVIAKRKKELDDI